MASEKLLSLITQMELKVGEAEVRFQTNPTKRGARECFKLSKKMYALYEKAYKMNLITATRLMALSISKINVEVK